MKHSIVKLFYYIVVFLILSVLYSMILTIYTHFYYHHNLRFFILMYLFFDLVLFASGIGLFYRKEWVRRTAFIVLLIEFLLKLWIMFGAIISIIMFIKSFSFTLFISLIFNFCFPLFLIVSCFILLFHPSIKSTFKDASGT